MHCVVKRELLDLFQKKIMITCKEENCGKQFTSAYNYQLHVKRHQQRFSFICQICGKGFMNCNHHDSHTYTHMKEKPFPCDICSKWFLTKSNLLRHKTTCRIIVKNHHCIVCGKKFITEQNLIRHRSQVHRSKEIHTCFRMGMQCVGNTGMNIDDCDVVGFLNFM